MAPPDPPDLRGYVEHAVIGGYPDPVLGVPASRRTRWQLSYLDRLLIRDALDVDTTRDPARLLTELVRGAIDQVSASSSAAAAGQLSPVHRAACGSSRARPGGTGGAAR